MRRCRGRGEEMWKWVQVDRRMEGGREAVANQLLGCSKDLCT